MESYQYIQAVCIQIRLCTSLGVSSLTPISSYINVCYYYGWSNYVNNNMYRLNLPCSISNDLFDNSRFAQMIFFYVLGTSETIVDNFAQNKALVRLQVTPQLMCGQSTVTLATSLRKGL